MDTRVNLDNSIDQALQQTERYYREQIFSSGCSSMVPIYRIHDGTRTVESLESQLNGSPYIQKQVSFSEKIISTLLDVSLYRYKDFHFFFNGDVHADLQGFIESECKAISTISNLVAVEHTQESIQWKDYLVDLDPVRHQYPVLDKLDLEWATQTISNFLSKLELPPSVESHLNILCNGSYGRQMSVNRASMYTMLLMGKSLNWPEPVLAELILIGFLKDIGYTRMDEGLVDFEIMHPLISHKLLDDAILACEDETEISSEVLNSVLVHHEFCDSTGPLARMRHPSVTQVLNGSMPASAQVSGICDLYFGFLAHYSEGLSYAITLGFVVGQGDVPHRYDPIVVESFESVLRQASFDVADISQSEAQSILTEIVGLFASQAVRNNTLNIVMKRSETWIDRIALAMNIVRNIANRDPSHLNETSFVELLNLPVEFGLNY
jgi:hypothetical protein